MMIYRLFKVFVIFIIMSLIFTGCSNVNEEEVDKDSDIIELSQEVIKNNNIISETVEERPVILSFKANGEIKKNEDKYYTISSIVQGRVVSAPVKAGDCVKEGQVLAYIQNPEITKINAAATSALHENKIAIHQAETRFKLAKQNYEREQKLYNEGISARKDLNQAESDYIIAKDDLNIIKEKNIHIKEEMKALMVSYGITPDFVSEELTTKIPVIAMKEGIVTKKNIPLGSIVTPEQILFEVTDMKNLWLDIIIYPDDIANVKPGQKIEFTADNIKDKIFTAKIEYILPVSNEETQTYTARAFLNNTDGVLYPGIFGKVKIITDTQENKVFVYEKAIQKYGKENFVFVDLGNGKYKKQPIVLQEQSDEGYFVDEGIALCDKIVTDGSFILKSEILKSEFAEED